MKKNNISKKDSKPEMVGLTSHTRYTFKSLYFCDEDRGCRGVLRRLYIINNDWKVLVYHLRVLYIYLVLNRFLYYFNCNRHYLMYKILLSKPGSFATEILSRNKIYVCVYMLQRSIYSLSSFCYKIFCFIYLI